MAKRLHLTKPIVEALPAADPGRRAYYNDDLLKGLQLSITDKGTKTYCLYRKIAGRPERIKLGRHPDISAAQARTLAEREAGKIAHGRNPNQEKRTERIQGVTLSEALEAFLKTRKGLRPKTIFDYRGVVERVLEDWKDKPIATITKDMVVKEHTKIGHERGQAYANLCMRVLRAIMNFAAAHWEDNDGNSLITENPVKRLSQTRAWYPTKRRQTVIKAHQLPDWYKAVQKLKEDGPGTTGETVADYLFLILFTGLRKTEALNLTWDRVDLKDRTLQILDTKNREPHTLPLSDYLFDLLSARHTQRESEYVFPRNDRNGPLVEPRKHLARVTKSSGIEFAAHDLRRSFITVAESLDISAYALKRLLNHKMSHDVTAGYIIMDVERLRNPMKRISEYLLTAANEKSGAEIVSLVSTEGNVS